MNIQPKQKWITSITLLTFLALSGCTSKAQNKTSSIPETPNSQTYPVSATSPVTPSVGTTRSSSSATISPEAKKLGVLPVGATCPSQALIKGNVSKRGNIYHLPSTVNYNQVKPEICFANAATAEKAGFRAPK